MAAAPAPSRADGAADGAAGVEGAGADAAVARGLVNGSMLEAIVSCGFDRAQTRVALFTVGNASPDVAMEWCALPLRAVHAAWPRAAAVIVVLVLLACVHACMHACVSAGWD